MIVRCSFDMHFAQEYGHGGAATVDCMFGRSMIANVQLLCTALHHQKSSSYGLAIAGRACSCALR